MISLVSYKDRTKKSSIDSMKSYMILVWNQRNFNPGVDYCLDFFRAVSNESKEKFFD